MSLLTSASTLYWSSNYLELSSQRECEWVHTPFSYSVKITKQQSTTQSLKCSCIEPHSLRLSRQAKVPVFDNQKRTIKVKVIVVKYRGQMAGGAEMEPVAESVGLREQVQGDTQGSSLTVAGPQWKEQGCLRTQRVMDWNRDRTPKKNSNLHIPYFANILPEVNSFLCLLSVIYIWHMTSKTTTIM